MERSIKVTGETALKRVRGRLSTRMAQFTQVNSQTIFPTGKGERHLRTVVCIQVRLKTATSTGMESIGSPTNKLSTKETGSTTKLRVRE